MPPKAPSPTPTPFGARLRALRQKRGWTMYRLAQESGLSAQAIGDLEKGIRQSPLLSTLAALARALEVPVADLIEGNEPG
jgi:transcriptional regulator with XRE-family HTH domain